MRWIIKLVKMFLQSYLTASATSIIEFVRELLAQDPDSKILLLWDGESHHCPQEFRDSLVKVNQRDDWKVHYLRFALYAPKENLIENVWGQLKQTLRLMYSRCRSFKFTILLFEILVKHQLFSFTNFSEHNAFSNLI